jgi:hypothetical protein
MLYGGLDFLDTLFLFLKSNINFCVKFLSDVLINVFILFNIAFYCLQDALTIKKQRLHP